jgi:hypothetical protein
MGLLTDEARLMKPLVMIGAGPSALPRIIAEAAAAGGAPLAGYLDFGPEPQPPRR